MATKVAHCCRGCLTELNPSDIYSFQWTEIRELFEDCTNLKVPTDEVNLPQNLCSECYAKCEQWYSFRTTCHEIDKFIRSSSCPTERDHVHHSQIGIEITEDDEVQNISDDNDDDTSDWGALNFGELIEDPAPKDRIEQSGTSDDQWPFHDDEEEDLDYWDCPVCLMEIPVAIPVKDHIKEHLSKSDLQCPICNQSFSRSSKVYPHILSLHMEKGSNGTTPVTMIKPPVRVVGHRHGQIGAKKCPLCSKIVQSLFEHLKGHVVYGDKRCPICAKELYSSKVVRIHMVVHSGEQPYPCKLCNSKHSQQSALRRHIKRMHPNFILPSHNLHAESSFATKYLAREPNGEMHSHRCPQCKKGFFNRMNLTRHMIIHKNLKPYSCSMCKMGFNRFDNMKAHERKGTCKK